MTHLENTIWNKLDPNWRALKLDLFNNATDDDLVSDRYKLKLSASLQSHDATYDTWNRFRSSLNSEPRMLTRGTQSNEHDGYHYKMTRELYREIREDSNPTRINISKFYTQGNKRVLPNFSCCVASIDDEWIAWLIKGHTIYGYTLGETPNSLQRRNNIIATQYLSSKPNKPIITLEELGL